MYFITNKLGLLNTYPGIFLPISAMPIGLFLLRQFFINIPQEVEDAARMDGCGSMGVLLRVMVPMTAPALGALLIFIFLFTWNEFFWSLICLQRSKMLTLPIGLKIIMGAHNIEYGLLFGASFLAMLPSLIVFLVLPAFKALAGFGAAVALIAAWAVAGAALGLGGLTAPLAVHVRAKVYRIRSGVESWLDYPRILRILHDVPPQHLHVLAQETAYVLTELFGPALKSALDQVGYVSIAD